jgi:hypothetical protein
MNFAVGGDIDHVNGRNVVVRPDKCATGAATGTLSRWNLVHLCDLVTFHFRLNIGLAAKAKIIGCGYGSNTEG